INRMLFIFIIIGSVGVVITFCISVVLANWTIKPVDKAWQQQKQFVADASHELKTPLTVISANTDVILSNAGDTVESQSKWLNYIKEETKRMTKLVNSMLYIAKYDSNELKFAATQFDLSDILSSICLQYEALVFEKGKQLETEIEDKVFVRGDEDKIKQLINILLDNAQKYSTDNGKIKAMLSRDQKTGKIKLAVANTSDYIAPDKLEKIFDRFYRLDDSRNRKTGGSGLGLNIAKSIVEAHGGEIKATHENGVTCFMVIL
ncbi:MAG: sensor histidine kinase, partial [Porcipelethomonas sp.]